MLSIKIYLSGIFCNRVPPLFGGPGRTICVIKKLCELKCIVGYQVSDNVKPRELCAYITSFGVLLINPNYRGPQGLGPQTPNIRPFKTWISHRWPEVEAGTSQLPYESDVPRHDNLRVVL